MSKRWRDDYSCVPLRKEPVVRNVSLVLLVLALALLVAPVGFGKDKPKPKPKQPGKNCPTRVCW